MLGCLWQGVPVEPDFGCFDLKGNQMSEKYATHVFFFVFLVYLSRLVMITSRAYAMTDQKLREFREHIVRELPYRFGEEIELSLLEGEAVNLKFHPNPYGIDEYLGGRVLYPGGISKDSC